MKQLSVLFRNPLSPSALEDFSDSIGDVTGGLLSSEMKNITQMLSASCGQIGAMDCDSLGSSAADSSSRVNVSAGADVRTNSVQPLQNGFACHSAAQNSGILSSLPFVSSAAFPFVTVATVQLPAAVTSVQSVGGGVTASVSAAAPSSGTNRCIAPVPLIINSAHLRPSSAAAAAITPLCAAPVLHIGSLPGLQQLLGNDTVQLLTTSTSASPIVRGPSSLASPLQTLPNAQTLMKPSWRFVIDQRSPLTVATSAPTVPLAGIFPPFAAAFCSLPPPASSLTPVLKMSHPLAEAAALNTHHQAVPGSSVSLPPVGTLSLLSPASSLLLSSTSSSVLSSNVVRVAAPNGQTVFLPSSVACPAVDQKSSSNS